MAKGKCADGSAGPAASGSDSDKSDRWLRLAVPSVGGKSLKVFRNPAEQTDLGSTWLWSLSYWYDAAMTGSKKPLHSLISRNSAGWRDWFNSMWPGIGLHDLAEHPDATGPVVTSYMFVSILCWSAGAVRRSLDDRARGANFMACFLDAFLMDEETPLIVSLPKVGDAGEISVTVKHGWIDTSEWLDVLAEIPNSDFAALLVEDYKASAEKTIHCWCEGDIRRCRATHLLATLLVDPTLRRGVCAQTRAHVARHIARQLAVLVDLKAGRRTVTSLSIAELTLKTGSGHLKRRNQDLKAALQHAASQKKAQTPRHASVHPG